MTITEMLLVALIGSMLLPLVVIAAGFIAAKLGLVDVPSDFDAAGQGDDDA